MSDKKPARPGKLRWRPEKNPGVDARDQRNENPNGETPQKEAAGLRQIRGIGRDGCLRHCPEGKS
jgi:hypothetical protein